MEVGFKKLKLYHNCNHLQIRGSYKGIFTTVKRQWTTVSCVKTLSAVTLSGNVSGSIRCPYFETLISSTLKKCKWLKKLCADKTNDFALQYFEVFLEVRRFQTRNIYGFFRNLDPYNCRLNKKKVAVSCLKKCWFRDGIGLIWKLMKYANDHKCDSPIIPTF